MLLSTNLSLTPSCWHIGHMFFDNLLIISSGRAVFGSLSLRIAVAAIRSEQQIIALIAILAQPPSSSPMIAIRTSDRHGSNFCYNSHVLRRKHPVLGMKLNPLSLLFQLARYHRNNTFRRNHMFSVAMRSAWCACGRDGSRAYFVYTTLSHASAFRIFMTLAQLINREYLAFPTVKFFKNRLNS